MSNDRDPASFDRYYGKMPFLATPFQNAKQIAPALMGEMGVRGIPTVLIWNRNDGELRELDKNLIASNSLLDGIPRGGIGVLGEGGRKIGLGEGLIEVLCCLVFFIKGGRI